MLAVKALAFVLVVGCAFDPTPLADTTTYICGGWSELDQSPQTIEAETTQCWKVTVGEGMAVMPEGARACDADTRYRCLVVQPGETFHVFRTVVGDGKTSGAWVPCETVCD